MMLTDEGKLIAAVVGPMILAGLAIAFLPWWLAIIITVVLMGVGLTGVVVMTVPRWPG